MKYKSKTFDFNMEDYDSLSVSQLKRQADYWLRQYLLKDKSRNAQFCPLKMKHYDLSQMQVAHYIDRSFMNTRYDLTNCHLISKSSNEYDAQVMVDGFKSLHHKDYEIWLTKEYGVDFINNLRERSKIMRIFQREDYIEVIQKFRSNA